MYHVRVVAENSEFVGEVGVAMRCSKRLQRFLVRLETEPEELLYFGIQELEVIGVVQTKYQLLKDDPF